MQKGLEPLMHGAAGEDWDAFKTFLRNHPRCDVRIMNIMCPEGPLYQSS